MFPLNKDYEKVLTSINRVFYCTALTHQIANLSCTKTGRLLTVNCKSRKGFELRIVRTDVRVHYIHSLNALLVVRAEKAVG
jgi:hypothetical protein